MFKPTKLLKVVSVILIVISVFAVLVVIAGYAMLPQMEQMAEQAGISAESLRDAYTPLSIAISIASSALLIACGVLGIKGKSYKAALILIVIYIIYVTVSIIQSATTIGISALAVIDYILPVLYLWGLYQAKE